MSRKGLAMILAATALMSGLLLLTASGAIHKWERDNAYPFGKMCNSIFTLYEDTCNMKKPRRQ